MVFFFSQQVVLTTLLVACSTSFVLNAYNFLFLKRFAIYVWFAIAPLIWVVCPLTGAAWVTKTYLKYKLVVVNAWVDIPEVRFPHTAVKRGARAQFPPKLSLNKVLNFRKFCFQAQS